MSNNFALPATPRAAAIYGCAGTRLTPEEKAFFRDARPYGFILFRRNCESPEQVSALVRELREAGGWEHAFVLIDQEGGRVARLRPPHWRDAPPAARLAAVAEQDPDAAERAVYLNARLIAHELHSLGITVDCAPLADIPSPDAHDVIGDRAFGTDPVRVVRLARAMASGLLDGGVLPVLKHIPGHGRATADSHHELPVVTASLDAMEASDFVPFRALADLPFGMTAHVRYTALDAAHTATVSPTVIRFIRDSLGFDGLLMSDDLSMKALEGDFVSRTRDSLAAGCDVVLHCNGEMAEMKVIAETVTPLSAEAIRRTQRAGALLSPPTPFDAAEAQAYLAPLIAA